MRWAFIGVLVATTVGFGCAGSALGNASALTVVVPPDGGATKLSTPTFSGTASNDVGDDTIVTVKVYAGPSASGTPVQTLSPTRTGGSWSVGASSPLADGMYTVQAEQLLADTTTPKSTHTFTVDTHPPNVTLTTPANGAVMTDTTPGLAGAAGNASDDVPTVTVKIHTGSNVGGAVKQTIFTTQSGGAWSTGAGALPTGTYTAQATQSDVAGNVGTSAAHMFTITGPVAAPPPPANVPPTASFVAIPGSPLTGEAVTFVSTSTDPDGPIVSLAWDLNGDGVFGDASGAAASTSFATAGPHRVSLRVTDADGASAVASQTITVASRPPPALRLLLPFPIIRIAGRATRTGVTLRLLTAQVPPASRVLLSCRGRSCPRAHESRVAPGRAGSAGLRLVSFPRFARSLRAGVVLEVRVTRSGQIGKYTRFVVRRNKAPRRTDSCLMPAASTPKACPAS